MKWWMKIALFVVSASLGILCGVLWLKADYYQSGPIRVARQFVQHMEAKQFPQAYALTMKNEAMGLTLAGFEQLGGGAMYRLPILRGTSSRQSNGNRLRRWLSGVEVEMAKVDVELDGYAPLRLTLRRSASGEWRIAYIASHAG